MALLGTVAALLYVRVVAGWLAFSYRHSRNVSRCCRWVLRWLRARRDARIHRPAVPAVLGCRSGPRGGHHPGTARPGQVPAALSPPPADSHGSLAVSTPSPTRPKSRGVAGDWRPVVGIDCGIRAVATFEKAVLPTSTTTHDHRCGASAGSPTTTTTTRRGGAAVRITTMLLLPVITTSPCLGNNSNGGGDDDEITVTTSRRRRRPGGVPFLDDDDDRAPVRTMMTSRPICLPRCRKSGRAGSKRMVRCGGVGMRTKTTTTTRMIGWSGAAAANPSGSRITTTMTTVTAWQRPQRRRQIYSPRSIPAMTGEDVELRWEEERNATICCRTYTLYYVPVNSLTADKDEPVCCCCRKRRRSAKRSVCVFGAHDGSVDRFLNTLHSPYCGCWSPLCGLGTFLYFCSCVIHE